MSSLFDTTRLGRLELANRLVMAPMTRSRAGADGVPTTLAATYYAQRATAGLIITEGIQPSAVGQGYPATPGLHSDDQVAGWRLITDAVHAAGGQIFAQLMHVGRIGHRELTGLVPVAPSAVQPAGQVFTGTGLQDFETPRVLTLDEIDTTIGAFADAARRAIVAGFDGVEIHGANGYLVHQFLASGTNKRTDEYGGSVAGRIKFAVDVVAAVSAAIGPDRVGLRISPNGTFNDMQEDDADATYPALLAQLASLQIAYLHLAATSPSDELARKLRASWQGTLIANPALGAEVPVDGGRSAGEQWLEHGADLISFGRPFLANPDLVQRLSDNAGVNQPDPATFYGGDETGYTDYPALAGAQR